jgi:hypothetical protein
MNDKQLVLDLIVLPEVSNLIEIDNFHYGRWSEFLVLLLCLVYFVYPITFLTY